jgi:hypothetical protein
LARHRQYQSAARQMYCAAIALSISLLGSSVHQPVILEGLLPSTSQRAYHLPLEQTEVPSQQRCVPFATRQTSRHLFKPSTGNHVRRHVSFPFQHTSMIAPQVRRISEYVEQQRIIGQSVRRYITRHLWNMCPKYSHRSSASH